MSFVKEEQKIDKVSLADEHVLNGITINHMKSAATVIINKCSQLSMPF